ncbi:MAG: FkbM family methyltransferase [Flavobacteriaceae bacterium]|jgi:FkbM family methyltransferase
MRSALKKILIQLIPLKVQNIFIQKGIQEQQRQLDFAVISYAQEGEDVLIDRFLNTKSRGFYVDIGAHHPERFSNTYRFYQRGWRGINIDAMPGSMDAFTAERPEDINLELGISKEKGELTYYMFNEPALNTFSEAEAKKKDGLRDYKIIETRKIVTYPLNEILEKHLQGTTRIDFISIDVEGLDLEVVESNDWEKYRPTLLLVEDLKKWNLMELPEKSSLYQKMLSVDYELVAKTLNTLFFKDKRA